MGKNTHGGKNRKRGKNSNAPSNPNQKIPIKQPGQEYARVIKLLGGTHIRAKLFNGKEYICTIPGSFYKRVWIKPGDLILVSIRSFQEGRLDVNYKYHPDEERKLKSQGEINDDDDTGSSIVGGDKVTDSGKNDGVIFVNVNDEKDELLAELGFLKKSPTKKKTIMEEMDEFDDFDIDAI